MGFLRRKSRWQRAIDPVTDIDVTSLAKSGLAAAASALTLTVASAVVSSLRRKEQQ